MKNLKVELKIIGVIHSPYKTTNEAPPQGKNEKIKLEIYPEYQKGLKDIEGFSHLHIFYWLHESKDYNLDVLTPWDAEKHGLFTTRSPHRPNPLAHSVVKLLKKEKNILTVRGLDAIKGTPIIDIKPYIKNLDLFENSYEGWIKDKELKSH
ncbi:MAG: tRNA (N6-threonylcarbamoyladenosine(37)-N6)-methyltransferase TrmO [Candidatus Thermoplasmatota archaeon]